MTRAPEAVRRFAVMLRACACAACVLLAAPARADLWDECFADDDQALLAMTLYAARFVECPGFVPIAPQYRTAPMSEGLVRMKSTRADCVDYREQTWRGFVSDVARQGKENWCANAVRMRDTGR